MSIDISYNSFSSSRADKEWPTAILDLDLLRKHAKIKEIQYAQEQENELKTKEFEKKLSPELKKVQEKIFRYFDNLGYIIPWVEWDEEYGISKDGIRMSWSPDSKMKYLLSGGVLCHKDSDREANNLSGLILKTDARELYDEYSGVLTEYKRKMSAFVEQLPNLENMDENVELNARQSDIYRNETCYYVLYGSEYNKERLLADFILLDLYFGALSNDYFENAKAECHIVNALASAFGIVIQNEIFSKLDLIKIFENLSTYNLSIARNKLMEQLGWEKQEAEDELMDYLRSVKPIVQDLKLVHDTIFVKITNGEYFDPKSSELLLLKRAEKHAEEYKNMLLPVI